MNELANTMRRRRTEPPPEVPQALPQFVSTGSDLLNLALSDRIDGGYLMGTMCNLIGDSSSGKTMLALSTCAEVCQREDLNDWLTIFDDAEAANQFDIAGLYGKRLASRLIPPNGTPAEPEYSNTIQDFRKHIVRVSKRGAPFVYVLDSFDALSSEEEIDKVEEAIKASETGKEVKGSYGMEKAKMSGQILRLIVGDLKKTNGVLTIISQTRDNIDPMSFEKKRRSGGRALKFYATHEVWLAAGAKIKRKDRVIGVECLAKVSKNKVTGKVREVRFPIYYSYGVDNIGANIDFLVDEGVWTASKQGSITAPDYGTRTRTNLIAHIETEGHVPALRAEVQETWNRVETELSLKRLPKYQ